MSQRAGVLWVQGPHAPVPRPPASIAHSHLEVSSAPLWNKAIWSVTQLWGLNGASGTNISQFAGALNPGRGSGGRRSLQGSCAGPRGYPRKAMVW